MNDNTTTSKNLTKMQRQALRAALVKLDPQHPKYSGSKEVTEALNGAARRYLQSWVIPLIEAALYGEQYGGQAKHIATEPGAGV